MEKLTKSEQGDMSTLKEENDGKIVEKQDVIVKEAENAPSTSGSGDLIADEIDEAIAVIQAEAVKAAAKSIENTTVNFGNMKPSNLEIEAALSYVLIRDSEKLSINPTDHHTSLTECQVAANLAKKTSKEAQEIVVECQDLMETISSTMQVLQYSIHAFYVKASEASERGTDYDYNRADYYHTLASKYESSAKALENRARKLEVALNRVEECRTECSKYAVLAEEITDESLDESIGSKFSACWWNNKGRAAIIVALRNERAALFMMKRIWISVQEDKKYEKLANNTADDSDNAAQVENTTSKTEIVINIVVTILGLCLLSATKFLKAGSDSFNVILALALFIMGYCALYWSYKLYTCLRSVDDEQTALLTAVEVGEQTEPKDEFLGDCDRKLETVQNHLLKYIAAKDLGTESDTGGSTEMVSVGDI